jgi:hypothetical protein
MSVSSGVGNPTYAEHGNIFHDDVAVGRDEESAWDGLRQIKGNQLRAEEEA